MDKFSLYVPNFLPCKEYFDPKKNNACPGCGLALAARHIYKAAGKLIEKAVWEKPAGGDLYGGKTGVSLLKIKQGKTEVTVCLDNESDGTLQDAVKKQMPAIAVAEGFKYVATASPSYPFDLYDKMQRALDTEGKSYIHILCPCPVGWQFDPEITVKVGRWAVESRAFSLYEAGSGFYSQTVRTLKPRQLSDYIKAQERFSRVTDKQLSDAGAVVEKEYSKLLENVQPE